MNDHHCGHPDEKCIMKLKHCLLTKNSSYTTLGKYSNLSKCCACAMGLLTSAEMTEELQFEND